MKYLVIIGFIALPIFCGIESARANSFYECTHLKTGEKRFTDGGLPGNDWDCKGFGMHRGGFVTYPSKNPAGQSSSPAAEKGKNKAPVIQKQDSSFLKLAKRQMGAH